MSHYQHKLSFREKAGYSLGDGAANLVFQVLMAYQFMFFTQVLGLSAKAAGLLFLIGRFFDAFTDPAMGFVADRTKTKWGRFRPWLVWSALPFAGIFWLTFTSPGWSPTGQMVYAYIMYFLLMGVYTVNNVPYCALNGVMTGDVDERTSLSTYRFVCVVIIQFIVQGLTLPLVAKFGQGDDARGWSITMGIFAIATIFFFVICFFSVKERVTPDPKQKSSARQDMLDTFRNRPWVILFSATLMIFIMLVVRGGSLPLFVEHFADREALGNFIASLGLQRVDDGAMTGFRKVLNAFGLLVPLDNSNVHGVAYGVFGMLGTFTTFLGVLCSKPLSRLFGKRMVFVVSLIVTTLVTLWLYFIPATNIYAMLWQSALWGLAYGPTVPLLWSMIADTADFSEWKTGRRATGFTFAGVVFALKFGLGVGGYVQGIILGAYGYDSTKGSVLTERAIEGIRIASTIAPAAFISAAVAILLFYPISKKLNYQIGDELAQRRLERGKGTDQKPGDIPGGTG
jgi:Na+/melibiose symporter-like transporter